MGRMDGLMLLRQAREARLAVALEGGRLVIRGPKRAELVARLLIQNKPIVVAALTEPFDWHARHREALSHWSALHPSDEAAQLAWGEMQCRWHRLHTEETTEWQCAGCGERIGGVAALDFQNGSRVHLDKLDCLIRYGDRRRGAATRALIAMGLRPPAGEDGQ
jgi:hypothetical protein